MEITLLILGWVLGLFSTMIVEWFRDWREGRIVKPAILAELHELQYRLMHNVYLIESKHGALNHEFFQWAQTILTQYSGINSAESLLASLGPLLNLSKDEMAVLAQNARQHRGTHGGLSLRKHSLPILEANIGAVSKFDPIFRGKILEIKTRIEFLNEIIDDARYYFQLSFQNGITPENYQIADANLIQTYRFYGARAKNIVDLIKEVSEK